MNIKSVTKSRSIFLTSILFNFALLKFTCGNADNLNLVSQFTYHFGHNYGPIPILDSSNCDNVTEVVSFGHEATCDGNPNVYNRISCVCRKAYLRDRKTNKCVDSEDCSNRKCPHPNEEVRPNDFEKDCYGNTYTTVRKCLCKKNYLRDKFLGICVPRHECNMSLISEPSEKSCNSTNEYWASNVIEQKCNIQSNGVVERNYNCYCKPGYFREEKYNTCVLENDCNNEIVFEEDTKCDENHEIWSNGTERYCYEMTLTSEHYRCLCVKPFVRDALYNICRPRKECNQPIVNTQRYKCRYGSWQIGEEIDCNFVKNNHTSKRCICDTGYHRDKLFNLCRKPHLCNRKTKRHEDYQRVNVTFYTRSYQYTITKNLSKSDSISAITKNHFSNYTNYFIWFKKLHLIKNKPELMYKFMHFNELTPYERLQESSLYLCTYNNRDFCYRKFRKTSQKYMECTIQMVTCNATTIIVEYFDMNTSLQDIKDYVEYNECLKTNFCIIKNDQIFLNEQPFDTLNMSETFSNKKPVLSKINITFRTCNIKDVIY